MSHHDNREISRKSRECQLRVSLSLLIHPVSFLFVAQASLRMYPTSRCAAPKPRYFPPVVQHIHLFLKGETTIHPFITQEKQHQAPCKPVTKNSMGSCTYTPMTQSSTPMTPNLVPSSLSGSLPNVSHRELCPTSSPLSNQSP